MCYAIPGKVVEIVGRRVTVDYFVKHQLWGKRLVYLKGRKDRWKCRRCKKPFTEVWPGVKKWSRKTEEAEYQILELLRGKSFRQLAQENKVSDHEVRYLLSRITTITAPGGQLMVLQTVLVTFSISLLFVSLSRPSHMPILMIGIAVYYITCLCL